MELGPYELLDELGRGAMGRVYRARHRPTGAVRALKVLSGSPEPDTVVRFKREVASLARVAGDGVVPIHDSGLEQGQLYFAMALLEGGSLRGRLKKEGTLDWPETTRVVVRLARILERCHAAGLVHRDVKPENVLLDGEGRPWLGDFGCVRDLGASRLTETGTTIGTLAYMAPEVLNGEVAGASADVFALGVLLVELGTGRVPFAGPGVLAQVKNRARPELQGVPPELAAIAARALAWDPAARPSAGDLAAELEGAKARRSPVLARGLVLAAVGSIAILAAARHVVARRDLVQREVESSRSTPTRTPPEDPAATEALGDAHLARGELDEARRAYAKAAGSRSARVKLCGVLALLDDPSAESELKSLVPRPKGLPRDRKANADLAPLVPALYRWALRETGFDQKEALAAAAAVGPPPARLAKEVARLWKDEAESVEVDADPGKRDLKGMARALRYSRLAAEADPETPLPSATNISELLRAAFNNNDDKAGRREEGRTIEKLLAEAWPEHPLLAFIRAELCTEDKKRRLELCHEALDRIAGAPKGLEVGPLAEEIVQLTFIAISHLAEAPDLRSRVDFERLERGVAMTGRPWDYFQLAQTRKLCGDRDGAFASITSAVLGLPGRQSEAEIETIRRYHESLRPPR